MQGRITFLFAVLVAAGFLAVSGKPATGQPSPGTLEIVPGSFAVAPARTEAGAHADLSMSLEFAHDEEGHTFDDLRTAIFDLPAGFVGNPQAVPTCEAAEFLAGEGTPACLPASQLGTISFKGRVAQLTIEAILPLYNLVPADPGVPAEIGFRLASFAQRLSLGIRPRDGGLTVTTHDVVANVEAIELSIQIWGEPADPSHDPERGRWCAGLGGTPSCEGGEEAAGVPPRPFLANPTGCGPAIAEVRANSWEDPQSWSKVSAEAGPIDECAGLSFESTIETSASRATESPSNFAIALETPSDWTDPDDRVSSALRSARIALPQGFSLNPSVAPRLLACTAAQLAREIADPAADGGCPTASIVGSVEASTPILGEPVKGSLYLTEPDGDPSISRLAVHAVAEVPSAGVRITLPIGIELDPRDGRPTAVIKDAPQLPIERLAVSFGSGTSGPFVTPPLCGRFGAEAELAPFSAPGHPRRLGYAAVVDRGASEGPCPSPGSLPFHPRFAAASLRAEAGARSPFRLWVSREDGEARLGGFAFRLPAGLSVDLAATEVCPDQALAGPEPSCPQGSLLGRTLIKAGVGPEPAALPGHVHLAGPYAGSPFSVALVTSALLGPFDLGTIVVRAPVRLDSRTGALVVASTDPLPASIDGVPLRLRSVAIDLDQPGLPRNPTNCRVLTTSAVVEGAGDGGEPHSETLSNPYRVAGCRRLRFSPALGLRFLGAAGRNGHPGLRAVLISHPDEAALKRARITMPPDLLLDPARIGALCSRPRLASRPCSARAVVGRVRATSPLLREPLRGRLYLRRNPRAQLPDLVADLRNRQVDLEVVARLRVGRSGLSLVVDDAPDLPIAKLALVVAGGERGLLVRSTGLCRGSRHFRVRMVGHNGKVRTLRARLPAHCRSWGGEQPPRRPR